ncbi:hypothetical protein D3C81_1265950 [compost metagenome]
MRLGVLAAVGEVGHQDQRPGDNDHHRRNGRHQRKDRHDLRDHEQQRQRNCHAHPRKHQRPDRRTRPGQAPERCRCLLLVRQPIEHPRPGIHAAIRGRGCRSEHDKIDDTGSSRQAAQQEQLDERAAIGRHVSPRDHADDAHQRTDVEQQDAYRDGVDRLGQGLFRVLCLGCRGTNQFGAHERENRDLEPGQEAENAVGHDHSGGHQVTEGRRDTGWRRVGRGNHHQPRHHQQHDRNDLDQPEPELDFTERLHGQHVQPQQQEHRGECR